MATAAFSSPLSPSLPHHRSALTKTPAFRPAAARAGRERPQAAVAAFGNFGRCPFAGKR